MIILNSLEIRSFVFDESDLDFYGEFEEETRAGGEGREGGGRRFIFDRIFNEKRYFSSKKKKKRKTILEFLINANVSNVSIFRRSIKGNKVKGKSYSSNSSPPFP